MSAAARLLHFGKIATKRLFVFAALLTVFAAGGAAALWAQQSPAFAAFASGWKDLPRDRLDEFSRIYALIKRDYVEDVEGGNLIESAIRGMVGSLDPYSIYLNSEERQQLHRALAGEYGGIGIFVGQRDGYIEVISPIDETPATRAGIRGGDLIVGINGESTENMDIDTAIGMMRGKPGTNVSLLVATPAVAAAPRALTLAREVVTSPSVRSALIEPDYGYLRLTQFQQAKSARDMALNLASLYAANGRDLRGLILDLRNNPGGGLPSSIAIASMFLPAGLTVVATRGRIKNEDREYLSSPRHYQRAAESIEKANSKLRHADFSAIDKARQLPVVLMVNRGSASASEILAGALKDHRRAVIVGDRTYGKASVQKIVDFSTTAGVVGVKLTTQKYFTPLGSSIHQIGIEPDIFLAPPAAPAAGEAGGETAARGAIAAESFAAEDFAAAMIAAANAVAPPPPLDEAAAVAAAVAARNDGLPVFLPRRDFDFDRAVAALKTLADQPAVAAQ